MKSIHSTQSDETVGPGTSSKWCRILNLDKVQTSTVSKKFVNSGRLRALNRT